MQTEIFFRFGEWIWLLDCRWKICYHIDIKGHELQIDYKGLTKESQNNLNVSAGGSLKALTASETIMLIAFTPFSDLDWDLIRSATTKELNGRPSRVSERLAF